MSIKSVKRHPGLVLGWKRIALIFNVSERTIRRWAEKARIKELPRIKRQVLVPKEHLYFFWLRVCRFQGDEYRNSMAMAGHALIKFMRKEKTRQQKPQIKRGRG